MDAVLSTIQGLSGSASDLQQLNQQLRGQAALLLANAAAIPQALQALDPLQHALGILHLL